MKILIIESDAPFAERLREVIGARGLEVEITADGKDGLDRAHADRPDAIVLAVELGEKLTGGYAYCNKLKKDDALRTIPLVLISSQATPETFEQHRKLRTRAEEYLIKPFDPSELLDVLGGHLDLPPPDVEIDDLAEGMQVEEMETFELTAAGQGGPADEDGLGLDEAFSTISSDETTAPTEAAAAGEEEAADELRLEELPGESDPPAPRASPTPGPARPMLTPGPAAAAAEAAMQIAELKGQIAELEVKLETAQRDLEELRASDGERVERLEADLARKDSSVKAAQARADMAQAQVRKLEATLQALKDDAGRTAALEEELGRVTQERSQTAGRLAEVELELAGERDRAAQLQRDLDTARQQLHEVRLEADTEGDRLRARIAELEGQAARNEDRVIKAYQKIKGDEKVKEKTKKALAIALQLLEEHPVEDDEVRTS